MTYTAVFGSLSSDISRINADTMQSLWRLNAKASSSGMLGFSAALWPSGSQEPYEMQRPASIDTHVVSIWISGKATSQLYLNERPRFKSVRTRGTFQLARAGESVRAVLSKASGCCLDLYLPNALLQKCFETEFADSGRGFELLPLGLEQDPVVSRIGDMVARELEFPDCASSIAIDSASLLLAVTLIRNHSNLRDRLRQPGSGLAEWQKKRSINRLKDAIETDVSLASLASDVGLSPFHFARAFKRSVGVAPHRFHIQLRMERARTLLASTTMNVAEIAAKTGYADAGYFARVFRQQFGVTPNKFRQELGLHGKLFGAD